MPTAKATKRTAAANGPAAKKPKVNGSATKAARSSSPSSSASSSVSQSESSLSGSSSSSADVAEDDAEAVQPTEASRQTADAQEPDFDAWYLRAVTEQFGGDLEKLRQAPDFKDSSVPILIDFLSQGASLFSEEEKKSVMATK